MTVRAYVGIGSNIDAERNVLDAIRTLQRFVRVVAVSTFHRTAPIGRPEDPWFVNGVVALDTDAPPLALKRDVLDRVEHALGRRRGADRDAPRTIDLDLLAYDDEVCRTEALTLPAPEIAERAFVARALAELAPELGLPDGRSVRTVAEALAPARMVPLPELTATVRRLLEPGTAPRSDAP